MKSSIKKAWWMMGGVYTYSAEYLTLIARATALGYTLPSIALQQHQDTFLKALKAAGLWDQLDVLYVPLTGTTSLSNFAMLNWKSPSSFQLTLMNSPTFGAFGWTGNGSNMHLKTGWIPTVSAVNYTLNNAEIFCEQVESLSETKSLTGATKASSTSRTVIDTRLAAPTDQPAYYINQANTATFGSANEEGAGFWELKRTASNATQLLQDGTVRASDTFVSNAMPDKEFYILGDNVNGTLTLPTAYTFSIWGSGSALSSGDSTLLRTYWNTYKQSVLTGTASSVSFPTWDTSNSISDYLTARTQLSVTQFEKLNLFGTGSATALGYEGGAVGKNGHIYCAVYDADKVMKINTTTKSSSLIGASFGTGGNLSTSGVLAPNGYVYFIPHSGTSVIKVNTIPGDGSEDTVSTFGSLSAATLKWVGGVLDPTGRYIICIPFSATDVGIIDTQTDTFSLAGLSIAGSTKFAGGTLYGNYVYMTPFGSTVVGKLDVSNIAAITYSTFGGTLSGSNKWTGMIIANSTYGYCVPYDSTTVLKINFSNDTVSTFGSLSAASQKWSSGALALNGKIYSLPQSSVTSVLSIDPSTDTASTILSVGSNRYVGTLLAKNGQIWGIPYSLSGKLCNILSQLPYTLSDDVVLSRFYNKY